MNLPDAAKLAAIANEVLRNLAVARVNDLGRIWINELVDAHPFSSLPHARHYKAAGEGFSRR